MNSTPFFSFLLRVFSVHFLRISKILVALIGLCFATNSLAHTTEVKAKLSTPFPTSLIFGDSAIAEGVLHDYQGAQRELVGMFETVSGGPTIPASDVSIAPGTTCPFGVWYSSPQGCLVRMELRVTDPAKIGKTVTVILRANTGRPDHPIVWDDPIPNSILILAERFITANASPDGSIVPSGRLRTGDGYSQTYTVTPNQHYRIDSVIVDGVSVGAVPSYTFSNIHADHNIIANFAIITHTISTLISKDRNLFHGTITPSGNIIVNDGANQTFQIIPSEHYHIADVKADGTSVGKVASYTFPNVTSDHTITASFESDIQIQATTVNHGTIIPSGNVIVDYGADQQFTLKPDNGYQVDNVLIDDHGIGPVSTYTFSNVTTKDHTIVGIFSPLKILKSNPGTFIYTDIGSTDPNKNIIIYNGNNVTATDINYSLEDSLHNIPMPTGLCQIIAPRSSCTLSFLGVDNKAYGNGNLNLQYKLQGSSSSYNTPVRVAVNNAIIGLQDQSGKEVAKVEFPKTDQFPVVQSFTLHNIGKFILQNVHLNLSDSRGGKFSIIDDRCSSSNLAINDACTFKVKASEINTSNLVITGSNMPLTTIPIEVDGGMTIIPDLSDKNRHLTYRAIYLHNTTGTNISFSVPKLDGDIANRVKYCTFGDNNCKYQSCDLNKPFADGAECWLWFRALDNNDDLINKSGSITITTGDTNQVSKTFNVQYDKSLYLGGSFTKTSDGAILNRFAKYDGNTFQPLGLNATNQGLNNAINTLALSIDGDLYVGGDFTSTGDNTNNMYHIAKYDGTQFQGVLPLNSGVDDSVYALTFSPDQKLYVGGGFKSSLDNVALHHIAQYGNNGFSRLKSGLDNGSVYALAFAPNGDLYLGGDFQQSRNLLVHRVAKYTEKNGFTALGNSGLDGLVNAIAYSPVDQRIYIGGVFLKAKYDGAALNHITKYNPTTDALETLGNTYTPGLSNDVQSLVFSSFDNSMYIGGDFINSREGIPLHRLTRYINDKFQPMLPGIYRFSADITHVNALTFDSQGKLYLGGDFTVTDDNNHSKLSGIATYNLSTQQYQMLGNGLDVSNGAVNALLIAPALTISE